METVKQIIIVGPTASGKTGLSIAIAKRLNGQIVSADSRAIYKELDIGTAKPSTLERQGIVHYGLDLVFPNERFSSIKFKEYASDKVKQIQNSGKMPIIVGGSGLYIDSYLFDYRPPAINKLNLQHYESLSVERLQEIVVTKNLNMPENKKNKLHLINTILRNGSNPIKNDSPIAGSLIIGIRPNKSRLETSIRDRADYMFKQGVLEEAESAYEKYGYYAPGLRGGIYAELVKYYKDGLGLEIVKENIIKSDMHLAKRQITWFKRNKFIKWFSSADEAKRYAGLIN